MKTKQIKSPFSEFPGSITIPKMLDAMTYQAWYERVNEIDQDNDEKRHPIFQIWDCRFPFIIKHNLQIPDGYAVERSGLKLPAVTLASWFIRETEFLIDEAQNLKN